MFLWIASLDLVDKRDAVTLLPNSSSPRSPTHPVVDTICKLLLFVLGTVICAAPLFSPYAALPLSQQVRRQFSVSPSVPANNGL